MNPSFSLGGKFTDINNKVTSKYKNTLRKFLRVLYLFAYWPLGGFGPSGVEWSGVEWRVAMS